MPRKRLFHLQALRGLAASLVVLSHSVDATQGGLYAQFEVSGYFGVATFFIISGFIIYKTSGQSFGSLRGAADFVVKRLLRIFPIYWIATLLFVAFSPHRASYSLTEIICSLLLIPHYMHVTDGMNPLVGQGWSLHYELLFYGLFAVGLLGDRLTGILLPIIALLSLFIYGQFIRPDSDATGPLTLLQYYSRPIILLFPIGIAIALLEERLQQFEVLGPFWAMLMLITVWFWFTLTTPLTEADLMAFPVILVIWGLGALCVFVSVFGRRIEDRFEKVAEAFGDASYSVYLFHAFVLSILVRLKFQAAHPVLYVIVALIGANLVGYLIYIFIENPILIRSRRALLGPTIPMYRKPR